MSITYMALHPGTIKTTGMIGFLGSIPYFGGFVKKYARPLFLARWRTGAMTVILAAAGREVVTNRARHQGAYLVPIATIESPSKFAQDERLQRTL